MNNLSKLEVMFAKAAFKHMQMRDTFVAVAIVVVVIAHPVAGMLWGVSDARIPEVTTISATLAVIACTIVLPFAWLRELVFAKSTTLQRRYAIVVYDDRFSRKLTGVMSWS